MKDCKRNFRMSNSSFADPCDNDKSTTEIIENLMYLNTLGQHMIVTNSLKAAPELLDRRANIYSDRPRQIGAHEILCGGLFTALMSCEDLLVLTFPLKVQAYIFVPSWRLMRRAQHEVSTKAVVRDYRPTFSKEAIILASSILRNPKSLDQHVKRSSASATMSILYGYPTLEDGYDETVREINTFGERLSAAGTPREHLVELLTWVIYIPERCAFMPYIVCLKCLSKQNPRFARWKRERLEHFRQHTALFNRCLNTVCDDIVSAISCVFPTNIS